MKAKVTVYADHVKNTISPNIFGHFMEHCVDVIYGSVYDPQHPLADQDGFRTDVLEALREVKTPMLRYPGGNFVSNYHWENGIGPIEKRPKLFDYAWGAEDDNRFGTVEFIKLCQKIGAQPYICVNMGSGTAEEAMNWVEFCNGTGDTKYALLRKNLGYEAPFDVKYWGLGNELYGDWQFGACSASDYAKRALDFAKAMKWRDPSIKLVACGHDIGSEWNYTVSKVLKPLIDHVAIHHYSIGYDVFKEENYEECMYIPEYISKLTKVAKSDIIAGTGDALTDIKVAWDEWNTHAWDSDVAKNRGACSFRNAILTAGILHSFLRDSDTVEIASYSPFVNVCGALEVYENGVVRRPQYYVFKMMAEAFGICDQYIDSYTVCDEHELDEVIDFSNRIPEPKFALDAKSRRRKVKTPYVDCIAAMNEDRTKLVLSILNKHPREDCEIDTAIFGVDVNWAKVQRIVLYNDNFEALNTKEEPDQVTATTENPSITNGKFNVKKHSLNIILAELVQEGNL